MYNFTNDLSFAESTSHTENSSLANPTAQSLESLLQQQLLTVRNAAQQRQVEEIIYTWSLHNLSKGSMSLKTCLDAQQESSCQQVCALSCRVYHPADHSNLP